MELIQKVFLLKNVDLLGGARSEQLARVAAIADVVEAEPGARLLRRGEPPEAMYVVVEGEVELRRDEARIMVASEGVAFGTWALVDERPSVVDATVLDETATLLRVARWEFHDLLDDSPELAVGILQGLSGRLRGLVEASEAWEGA